MKYELWYSVTVRDRNGKVVSRERRKSRSFLKQWNELVYVHMKYVYPGTFTITDVDGNPRSISNSGYSFRMTAPANQTAKGIRVGTGNTPVAIDDYALETPIEQGTGVGQMEHLVCTVADHVVAPPSCYIVVSRTIANNSGGVITVREAAIYMWMYGITAYSCCATRDVLAAPQAVPDGGSITIDWTIGVTV